MMNPKLNWLYNLIPILFVVTLLIFTSITGIFSGSETGHVFLAWGVGSFGGVFFVYTNFMARAPKASRRRWGYIIIPLLAALLILISLIMTGIFVGSESSHIWMAWVFGIVTGIVGTQLYWFRFSPHHRSGRIK